MSRILHPNLILVEGKDEVACLGELLAQRARTDVQVLDLAGKTRLRDNLKTLRRASGFSEVTWMGVVRDADEDAGFAFQSVSDALRDQDFVVPASELVVASGSPSTTVLILPGGGRRGSLETLCLEALQAWAGTPCVEQYMDCLESSGVALSPEASTLAKTRLQVWQAAASPGQAGRAGLAAQGGLINLQDPAFGPLHQLVQLIP